MPIIDEHRAMVEQAKSTVSADTRAKIDARIAVLLEHQFLYEQTADGMLAEGHIPLLRGGRPSGTSG